MLKRLVSAQRARASRVARTAMPSRRGEINYIPYRRWKSRALEMFQKMRFFHHTCLWLFSLKVYKCPRTRQRVFQVRELVLNGTDAVQLYLKLHLLICSWSQYTKSF